MKNDLSLFKKIIENINKNGEDSIYSLCYYYGINEVKKDLSEDEIIKLLDLIDDKICYQVDPIDFAKTITKSIYTHKYCSIDELNEIPSDYIYELYDEEKLEELSSYKEDFDEDLNEDYYDKI